MNDPFQYIGRVTARHEDGRVKTLDVIYQDDTVTLSDDPTKNDFITFVTVVDLARKPE